MTNVLPVIKFTTKIGQKNVVVNVYHISYITGPHKSSRYPLHKNYYELVMSNGNSFKIDEEEAIRIEAAITKVQQPT